MAVAVKGENDALAVGGFEFERGRAVDELGGPTDNGAVVFEFFVELGIGPAGSGLVRIGPRATCGLV